ncbi:serine acetyltransferase [Raoultella planticola]|uniref:serine acetyltransferase n=1 Tax=Raoultella planticola TaxID=575 RepID=UPI0010627E07|nr:serine acetyltransferase [Raoultella planticola]MCE9858826.1 serine acetyltransferase [Raoultella planticola]TDV13662.1 putative colanic acid biosynthesis acetyltransferase WcaB [Raoultella planticola]TDX39109.1 putative colanic acid biosynthesis acetyltransferase WcaB [Raoultella planticola]HAT1634196.1 serine acetyltransferase [Raoultella planticola]HAT1674778.1 serine acetyltransferase [Raoultella planticola]
MFESIRQVGEEIKHAGGMKAKIALLLYRLATLFRSRNPIWKLCALPFVILNKIINECLFCVEIPWQARIGYGLKLFHPHCIVINRDTVIGSNCTLRQGVTIGSVADSNGQESISPLIGNNVEFGAHAVVIGPVTLGDNVKVGAGTVVTKDLPDGAIVVGQPYRILKTG